MDETSLDEMLLSSPDKDEQRDKVDDLPILKLRSANFTRSTSNFYEGIDKSPALEEFSSGQILDFSQGMSKRKGSMKSQRSNSVGNQQLGQFLKILNPESEIKQAQ